MISKTTTRKTKEALNFAAGLTYTQVSRANQAIKNFFRLKAPVRACVAHRLSATVNTRKTSRLPQGPKSPRTLNR